MLVLTRKTEQKIHIGSEITITILQVRGGKVRIGVDAPADLKILRSELSPLPSPSSNAKKATTARGQAAAADTAQGTAPHRGPSVDGADSSEDTSPPGRRPSESADPRRPPRSRWRAPGATVPQRAAPAGCPLRARAAAVLD